MRFILRGRRSIWWHWRVTVVAPRILNDVSYVTRINHEMNFAWQAQYLVNLSCDFCWSAHCKWRFICDADQSWDSFCVAGALFGELVVWRLLLQLLVHDVSYVTPIYHEGYFAWQAQYLVKVEGDSCCSAHSKWRFICDADQSWDSFCVAGAVIGEFEGGALVAPRIGNDVSYVTRITDGIHFACQVQYLVKMDCDSCCSAHCKSTFHMWRGSIITVILRGRCSIAQNHFEHWTHNVTIAGHITWHRIASRDMTQHKQSHRIKWHDHHIKWHDMHQNRSHHHHGTAEGSFTAKKWFGHRAGRSPCAHSIGKFVLCYIVLFSSETSAPGSPGNYLYRYLDIDIWPCVCVHVLSHLICVSLALFGKTIWLVTGRTFQSRVETTMKMKVMS